MHHLVPNTIVGDNGSGHAALHPIDLKMTSKMAEKSVYSHPCWIVMIIIRSNGY